MDMDINHPRINQMMEKRMVDEVHVQPTLEQKLELFTMARQYLVKFWNMNEPDTKCICDCLLRAQRELNYVKSVEGHKRCLWSRNGRQTWAFHDDNGNNMEGNFPELLAYKPKGKAVGSYWWSMIGDTKTDYGHKRRIRVCTMVIMDLQRQIKANGNK